MGENMKESNVWYLAFALVLLSGVALAFAYPIGGVVIVCISFGFLWAYRVVVRREKLVKKKERVETP